MSKIKCPICGQETYIGENIEEQLWICECSADLRVVVQDDCYYVFCEKKIKQESNMITKLLDDLPF